MCVHPPVGTDAQTHTISSYLRRITPPARFAPILQQAALATAYLFKVPEGAAKGVDPGFFHQMVRCMASCGATSGVRCTCMGGQGRYLRPPNITTNHPFSLYQQHRTSWRRCWRRPSPPRTRSPPPSRRRWPGNGSRGRRATSPPRKRPPPQPSSVRFCTCVCLVTYIRLRLRPLLPHPFMTSTHGYTYRRRGRVRGPELPGLNAGGRLRGGGGLRGHQHLPRTGPPDHAYMHRSHCVVSCVHACTHYPSVHKLAHHAMSCRVMHA